MEPIFQVFPTIASIAVICFMIGELLKLTPMPTKWIPAILPMIGGVLGVIGAKTGISELQNMDILSVIATGICSALVATGVFSTFKNLTGQYGNNEPKHTAE